MPDKFQEGRNEAARGYSRPAIKPSDPYPVKEKKQAGFNYEKQIRNQSMPDRKPRS